MVIGIVYNGTSASESITGTDYNDTLNSGGGLDTIIAGLGNDSVNGSFSASPTIYGGDGNDTLDEVYQGVAYGEIGDDYIWIHESAAYGGNGNDTVRGFYGTTIDGGAGNDNLAIIQADLVEGGNGNDTLECLEGLNMTLSGGAGNDIIYTGYYTSQVTLQGGADQDKYIIFPSGIDITIEDDGGILKFNDISDEITPVYNSETQGLEFYINGSLFTVGVLNKSGNDLIIDKLPYTDNDQYHITIKNYFSNVANWNFSVPETVNGAAADNYAIGLNVTGTDSSETLAGGKGNDYINGLFGNDTIDGKEGNDSINDDGGSDLIHGGSGDDYISTRDYNYRTNTVLLETRDTLYGDLGDDTVTTDSYKVTMHGQEGNDNLQGGTTIYGGEGDDYIVGFYRYYSGGSHNDPYTYLAENTLLEGGLGDDTITANRGNDTIRGGSDNDNIYAGAGNDAVRGDDGNDTLYGNESSATSIADIDTLQGDAGDDVIYGANNKSFIYGGTGNDSLYGNNGQDLVQGNEDNDYIFGGGATDNLYGMEGNDTLEGGGARDQLNGGEGADIFLFTSLNDSNKIALDRIVDFSQGTDKIDISALGFTGIHAGNASSTELGYAIAGNKTVVSALNTGNNATTFYFEMTGNIALTNSDFIFS